MLVLPMITWHRARWETARADQPGMTTETVVGVGYHIRSLKPAVTHQHRPAGPARCPWHRQDVLAAFANQIPYPTVRAIGRSAVRVRPVRPSANGTSRSATRGVQSGRGPSLTLN
jgi:hypothetical protein